jgi:hypothetical protein
MENKENKYSKYACGICCVSPITFLLSLILVLIYSIGYNLEKLYRDACKNTWYDNPILDLSLIKENESFHEIKLLSFENKDTFCDCSYVEEKSNETFARTCSDKSLLLGCNQYNSSKIASKLLNSTLYISNYEGNYWTFFDRIRKNKYGEIRCKEDEPYKECGYLDSFENPLCVKDGQTCPLSYFVYSLNSNNELIGISNKTYSRPKNIFINKVIASEKEDATIFDINQILTYKDIRHYKINEDEKIFKLELLMTKYSSKKNFYRSNQFTNEPLPDWFNGRNVYYYHIIYPGSMLENQIRKRHIILFNNRAILGIRITILLIKIWFFCLSVLNLKIINKKPLLILSILNFVFILSFFVLMVLNIISFQGAHNMAINLNEYLRRKKIDRDNGNGDAPLVFDIINTILEFICLLLYTLYSVFYYLHNNKNESITEKLLIND